MAQSEMLRLIARHDYNVGFGAKKNFATYSLICKTSGWISFIPLAVGAFALFIPELAINVIPAMLIIFGVATMYIRFYNSEKQSCEGAGTGQTRIFNGLEAIYRNAKSDANSNYQRTQQSIDAIMSWFYDMAISKQISGSNWYVHYRFYCESEKAWVEEELNLTLKDKIPLSPCFLANLAIIFIVTAIWKTP